MIIFFFPIITGLPEESVTNSSNGSGGEESETKMSVSPNPTDYNVTFDWSSFATAA